MRGVGCPAPMRQVWWYLTCCMAVYTAEGIRITVKLLNGMLRNRRLNTYFYLDFLTLLLFSVVFFLVLFLFTDCHHYILFYLLRLNHMAYPQPEETRQYPKYEDTSISCSFYSRRL